MNLTEYEYSVKFYFKKINLPYILRKRTKNKLPVTRTQPGQR